MVSYLRNVRCRHHQYGESRLEARRRRDATAGGSRDRTANQDMMVCCLERGSRFVLEEGNDARRLLGAE